MGRRGINDRRAGKEVKWGRKKWGKKDSNRKRCEGGEEEKETEEGGVLMMYMSADLRSCASYSD